MWKCVCCNYCWGVDVFVLRLMSDCVCLLWDGRSCRLSFSHIVLQHKQKHDLYKQWAAASLGGPSLRVQIELKSVFSPNLNDSVCFQLQWNYLFGERRFTASRQKFHWKQMNKKSLGFILWRTWSFCKTSIQSNTCRNISAWTKVEEWPSCLFVCL